MSTGGDRISTTQPGARDVFIALSEAPPAMFTTDPDVRHLNHMWETMAMTFFGTCPTRWHLHVEPSGASIFIFAVPPWTLLQSEAPFTAADGRVRQDPGAGYRDAFLDPTLRSVRRYTLDIAGQIFHDSSRIPSSALRTLGLTKDNFLQCAKAIWATRTTDDLHALRAIANVFFKEELLWSTCPGLADNEFADPMPQRDGEIFPRLLLCSNVDEVPYDRDQACSFFVRFMQINKPDWLVSYLIDPRSPLWKATIATYGCRYLRAERTHSPRATNELSIYHRVNLSSRRGIGETFGRLGIWSDALGLAPPGFSEEARSSSWRTDHF